MTLVDNLIVKQNIFGDGRLRSDCLLLAKPMLSHLTNRPNKLVVVPPDARSPMRP